MKMTNDEYEKRVSRSSWEEAKELYRRTDYGKSAHADVIAVYQDCIERAATIAKLREALNSYENEHAVNTKEDGIDAGMSYPPENCDCDNCIRARAILAETEK